MSFDVAAHRRDMLAHCLWMAQIEPDYAQWAADSYEARSPEVLANLGAKVRQEIRRAKAKSNDVPAQAS